MGMFLNKYVVYTSFVILGLLAGFGYWYFYGCTEGCAITGIWYRSSAYGGMMGFLSAGLVYDFIKPKT